MTRRHYIAFAAMLAGEAALARRAKDAAALEQLRKVMLSTADLFARDNGRFDRDRFYAACEIDRYAVQTPEEAGAVFRAAHAAGEIDRWES